MNFGDYFSGFFTYFLLYFTFVSDSWPLKVTCQRYLCSYLCLFLPSVTSPSLWPSRFPSFTTVPSFSTQFIQSVRFVHVVTSSVEPIGRPHSHYWKSPCKTTSSPSLSDYSPKFSFTLSCLIFSVCVYYWETSFTRYLSSLSRHWPSPSKKNPTLLIVVRNTSVFLDRLTLVLLLRLLSPIHDPVVRTHPFSRTLDRIFIFSNWIYLHVC